MKSACGLSSRSKYMSQFEQLRLLAWSVCPKLVLFFKALVVYAVLYSGGAGGGGEAEKRSDGRMLQSRGYFFPLFKCLPVAALMFFVALHSLRSASPQAEDVVEGAGAHHKLQQRSRAFALKIFLALLASCAGDFLIAVDMFDWGFGGFLLSHVIYMTAFGMGWTRRVRPLVLYILSAAAAVSGFQLIGGKIYGAPATFYIVINIIYTFTIFATLTATVVHLASYSRQRARRQSAGRGDKSGADGGGRSASPSKSRAARPSWLGARLERACAWLDVVRAVRVCAVCGAALFVVSDSCLMWNDFVHKVPLLGMLVMPTYYGAQLGLALAVADPSL